MTNKIPTKLGDKIWVVKNFLSKEECDEIIQKAESSKTPWQMQSDLILRKPNICKGIPERAYEIMKDLIDIEDDEFEMSDWTNIIKFLPGGYVAIHHDNYLSEQAIKYKEENPELPLETTVNDQRYSCVLYFNDHEGGEIFYPLQNVRYRVMGGDLLIHSGVGFNSMHGAMPLKSEVRYTYTGCVFRLVKVPKNENLIVSYIDYYKSIQGDNNDIPWDYHGIRGGGK